jgi:molecular chaperone HscB
VDLAVDRPATDPFATLGLPWRYEIDVPVLEARYRELQRALHPDRHVGAGASQRRLSLSKAVEVNEAYRVLKDDLKRADVLLAHHAQRSPLPSSNADNDFLMEVMELREALSEAKHSGDYARVQELAATVHALHASTRSALVAAFDALSAVPVPEALAHVSALIGRLKYYTRFLDEVSVIEEEALG